MPSLSDETRGAVARLMPGATIGIVGGGQLGRMMALSAKYMGFRVGVLDPTPDCPTAQVGDFQIVAAYDDKAAIRELAAKSDVLTYEFENVDADALDEVRGSGEGQCAVPQGTDLLRVTQNRIAEKSFINRHGIETAPWRAVNSRADLDAALAELGYPAVLKTCEGGYDGHGQIVLRSDGDLDKVWPDDGFPQAILEGFVDFAFEASILVSGDGERYVTFPIVRNVHRNNILHMTIAPAEVPAEVADRAHELALTLAEGFKLAGTLAIELFVTADGRVLVNELAPRPHNSGHYTIEACSIDQFDAHIRGIAGWPLAQPRLLSPAVMVNVLGQHVAPTRALIGEHPEWNVHDYGKAQVKHDRKMGHITVLTDDTAATVEALESTGCWDDLR
ncbi:5-(carboxyamino)imidazole ribonucleotide synthase [uncultured Bifidobacterium sp.]|uniref:5-(carboxyamino)imidazole ribonucleotide synthase n=2 Tax=uncultured Bifidobacterium sp. TaxID=165187 RepID=UPI0025867BD8|nr:5-(carboxyamino)imidazole ribonucleotide synthase [uncultured Bifidobacterium sp.]